MNLKNNKFVSISDYFHFNLNFNNMEKLRVFLNDKELQKKIKKIQENQLKNLKKYLFKNYSKKIFKI